MTLSLDDSNRRPFPHLLRRYEDFIEESFDESEEYEEVDESISKRPITATPKTRASSSSRMNVLRSTPLLGRRSRMSSLKSTDSTESSNSSGRVTSELPSKTTYRILVLGATNAGKSSIVRQFLYDQFSAAHKPTMDDMYRGEFEDTYGRTIYFDIQDVGGSFVYEFPAMKSVSLASADAFLLVFSLENAQSWDEVSRLRDMVIEAKDEDVPIVVVANKSDLPVHKDLPYESLEATAIFDWENGYVECSAKDRSNINKIFRELLNQAKSRFDVSVTSPQHKTAANQSIRPLPGLVTFPSKGGKPKENILRRRQSLPAVPAGMVFANPSSNKGTPSKIEEDDVFSEAAAAAAAGGSSATNMPKGKPRFSGLHQEKLRRSSLAALRRDSCKIS